MSTFCGGTGNAPKMTPSELSARYSGSLVFLPESMPPMPNGLADESWLRNYTSTLEGQGRIPKLPIANDMKSTPFDSPDTKDPLAEYVKKEGELQDTIKSEYCFYEIRYFSALDQFLQAVADSSLQGNAETIVQGRLDTARRLNQKVTLLTQITNAISKYRYNTSQKLEGDINSINNRLRERQKKLLEQRKILVKESAASDLHKRMVDYTTEKNKANTNLLTLYGILNITAIAMLFYIART
jgi:hypothetical protein